ncbi:MAG: uroporphyrinogen decarboxylase family protein [bacterium]|nr:uroporphyrinogen decarboxylase family protein [bacterium]
MRREMNGFFSNNVQPDFEGFRKCILREEEPRRVFFTELFLDNPVREALIERFNINRGWERDKTFDFYREEIALQRFLGYDMVRCLIGPLFPSSIDGRSNSTALSEDPVASGPIQSWKDFELYPWPEVAKIDLSVLDWLEKELPENMKSYVTIPAGNYKMLLGYENMLYMMYDDPVLMKAVIDRISEIHASFARTVCQYSCIGVLWGSDDMGFKTQTFFPPDFIRKNILPTHQALAEISHDHRKLYFLHSCGNLETIMDDLIDIVKIDAKHSFEDAVMSVAEAKESYGNRVALLGGIDVDFLCRSDEPALRKRVRKTLETCLNGGGYCLGSGNSIAEYVPLENYLVMLDEGKNYR